MWIWQKPCCWIRIGVTLQNWVREESVSWLPNDCLGVAQSSAGLCPFPIGSTVAFLWGQASSILLDVPAYYSLESGKFRGAASPLSLILKIQSILCTSSSILKKSKWRWKRIILYHLDLVARKGKCNELTFPRCPSGRNVSAGVGMSWCEPKI